MWQQLGDHAVALSWQACQHVPQLGMRIMPVDLGALDQAHDGCCDRPNLVFNVLVVDGQLPDKSSIYVPFYFFFC